MDFFTFTEHDLSGTGSTEIPLFDAAFDYTFLCALPPSWRSKWAHRMGKIIRPGGMLVTLMFPISTHEGGPPFAVSPELYRSLLGDQFEEIEISDCASFPAREGQEKLGIWKRK
jgi:hypothetical protein